MECKSHTCRSAIDGLLIHKGKVYPTRTPGQVRLVEHLRRIIDVENAAEPARPTDMEEMEWCEPAQTLYVLSFIEGSAETTSPCGRCRQPTNLELALIFQGLDALPTLAGIGPGTSRRGGGGSSRPAS